MSRDAACSGEGGMRWRMMAEAAADGEGTEEAEAAQALQATMDMNAMRRASVAAQLFSGCGFGSDKRVQRCAVA